MRRVVVAPAASHDLRAISEYVAEAAGAAIANKLVREVRGRIRLIAETPGMIGTHRPEIRDGLRSFPSSPLVVFFRYVNDEVQVVRVLHERQDVDRHL